MKKTYLSAFIVVLYLVLAQMLELSAVLTWVPLAILCGWTLIHIHAISEKNLGLRICRVLNVVVGGFSAVTSMILFVGFIAHNA